MSHITRIDLEAGGAVASTTNSAKEAGILDDDLQEFIHSIRLELPPGVVSENRRVLMNYAFVYGIAVGVNAERNRRERVRPTPPV